MGTVTIQHVENSKPPSFTVSSDLGRVSKPVKVPSPYEWTIAGSGDASLMAELRWYLEDYHQYPKHPNTLRAERVLHELREWGTEAFRALFSSAEAVRVLAAEQATGYADLNLRVQSNAPGVLSWPWEALRDPQAHVVAITCHIERRLADVLPVQRASGVAASSALNILMVTARPFRGDVSYRAVTRPLMETIAAGKLRANVHVLRPPTFANLCEHLRERKGHYHVLHFDGHGDFGQGPAGGGAVPGGRVMFGGPQGVLVFEDEKHGADHVSADTLSGLLLECGVPLVVPNACRSATVEPGADDPFASVAAALVRAGVPSVVAMTYSLTVSGAKLFVPAFYGELLGSRAVAGATRAGRQAMFADKTRRWAAGTFELEDSMIPVLYNQRAVPLAVAATEAEQEDERPPLPDEVLEQDPCGFIGRDAELLDLERAMLGNAPAILLTGLGGVGKTTLAKHFARWLADTEGIDVCFWFRFREGDIRSAEYVINSMVAPLFGTDALAQPVEAKIDALARALRDRPGLIVWDNFEIVAGMPDAHIEPAFPEEDREVLLRLLDTLRGGRTKVLITSRAEEE
jgi:hypothetical protein